MYIFRIKRRYILCASVIPAEAGIQDNVESSFVLDALDSSHKLSKIMYHTNLSILD